ncbi:MAG: hypothetical protein U0992_04490 [Planctomycetaceae bacterium]
MARRSASVTPGRRSPAIRVFVLDYQLTDGKVAANPGTSDKLAGRERLVCLNADTGEVRWEHGYDQPYSISYGSGPRTTPTVDSDHVYALGAEVGCPVQLTAAISPGNTT